MAGMLKGFKGLVMPTSLDIPNNITVEIWDTLDIPYSLIPSNSTNQKIRWFSSDETIATVNDDGVITGVSIGTATITGVVDANGITTTTTLTVTVVHVTGVTLDNHTLEVNAGEQGQLTATVTPVNSSNKNVTWSSSNTSIAVVDENGLVTYVGDGECTITVTTVDGGYTDSCTVTCISFVPVDTCFGYTGTEQSILLKSHTYCIEVWGAQGGYYAGSPAGKGGYAGGCITLNSDTCVYVYVGGVGSATTVNSGQNAGGYNGGGAGYNYSTSYIGTGGGGGTDVRIGGNTLYHRRIVAGGGGGGGYYSSCTAMCGGAGGGVSGAQGGAYSSYYGGSGGTQTAGGTNSRFCYMVAGSFGQGGYKTSGTNGYNGSGGGGGWYGGGAGSAVSAGGGGGSGYVYTSSTCSNAPSGYCHCTAYYLTNAYSCCGAVSFPSPSGGAETGHAGCGCVRIRSL